MQHSPPAGRPLVVAMDFDEALARGEEAGAERARRCAIRMRRHGIVTVFVTARRQQQVAETPLLGAFDAVVLEGGAVWGLPGNWTIHPTPTSFWDAADEVSWRGHDVQEGHASFSVPEEAANELQGLASLASWQANRDRIDVTPLGVDKGAGLMAAIADLGITEPWIVVVGDLAEDAALAKVADAAIPVAQAEPALLELVQPNARDDAQGTPLAERGSPPRAAR